MSVLFHEEPPNEIYSSLQSHMRVCVSVQPVQPYAHICIYMYTWVTYKSMYVLCVCVFVCARELVYVCIHFLLIISLTQNTPPSPSPCFLSCSLSLSVCACVCDVCVCAFV